MFTLLFFNPEAEVQIDEGVEMQLDVIIDSNINSKILISLILNNKPKFESYL